ncbi:hypothetical protein [Halomonas lysinitropha]|uniref:Uncharacterized protein n=1 Tax=Halomonas lysinitropha TaxID=2607506 RepID=A0A5K1I9E8_9GAMM|nr:hypothetical protein [Halomonas lysinitropha]VVZ96903.1 hypothetical protein HALO32_03010 [Halomonas lysinitropha]
MTAWYRAMGAGLLLVWLSGCGGSDEEAESEPAESTTTTAETREPSPEPSPEAPQVPPFDQPLMIDVSSSLGTDRRLTVKGETNLPEATRLQVLVERELSGMRWRERVSVEEGGFMAGPFGPGSGLPDGGYRVTVDVQEGSVQPRSVRERLGAENEHLSGPLVEQSGHGLGKVARYSKRYLVGDDARRTVDNVEVLEME